jgi:hypothetical protein
VLAVDPAHETERKRDPAVAADLAFVGRSRPAIMFMIVVFPVPFAARMPIDRPASIRKLARSRMTLRCVPVQNDLLTFSKRSMRHRPPPVGPGLTRAG